MKIELNLFIVAVLLSNIVPGVSSCSTQVGSRSDAAMQQQSAKKEVVIKFVSVPTATPKPEHMIIFKGGQTAFALGDYYYLLRTTDGGQSWQQLRPTPEDEKIFGGKFEEMVVLFRFITPVRGWMSAEKGVWQTEDGGITWRLIFPSRWKVIDFADEQYGWLSLYKDDNNVQNYITQNGGETWQLCGSASDEQTPLSTHFLTPQHGWGITRQSDDGNEKNGVARTADGGCVWQQLWTNASNPDERYSAIYFLNESEGWLAGESHLYHTTDGGKTWRKMPLPTPEARIGDVYFTNLEEGWVIAARKGEDTDSMFYTTNGGKTWRQLAKTDIINGSKIPAEWQAGKLFQMVYASERDW